MYTDKLICEEPKHLSEAWHGVKWQQLQGLACRPRNIWAAWFHAGLGFIDFRLNGWCRCSKPTTTLSCTCNILLSNKHQPGCLREQLSLFKALSFKGDELECLNWCNHAGGVDVDLSVAEFSCFIYLIQTVINQKYICILKHSLYLCIYNNKLMNTHRLSCLYLCLLIPVHITHAGDWRPCLLFYSPTGEAYLRASLSAAAQSWPSLC